MKRLASCLFGLLLSSCWCAAPTVATGESSGKAVDVSAGPQLFLDDHLVAGWDNLERALEQPRKHPANPLIVADQPWEKRMIELYGTVLYDARLSEFRCWYLASEFNDGVPDNPEEPTTAEYYMCYAESDDGIAWTKPLVGEAKFGRHERHNVVIAGGHGFCILATPDDPDPSRRYKGAGGPLFGFSPDGLRWSLRDWLPAVAKNDTNTSVVRWNGEYLAFVRYQVPEVAWPKTMRGVGLCTSNDFESWTPKQLVFTTDAEDGYPWTQPYSLAVTPYGDVLIGLVGILRLDRVEGNNMAGDQNVQLLVSRDGRRWSRVGDRQEFLAPTPEAWDRGRVFPAANMLVKDDRVWIYYTGDETRHGSDQPGDRAVGLATLPADRFVAAQKSADAASGTLLTPPLRFQGNELLVNAELREGDLQVELVDVAGNALEGFERDKSRLAVHDPLRYRVTWHCEQGERNLGDARAEPGIALRMTLRGGKLYAFQIMP